ncbi:TIM-barrel domain-containing protein [Candidatus Izemoplasma sp. B36]|uniref:glycoside hydrolase family 31 protein n=1 Tax=Candidatus Izemoplasma sp. B36 TaxID=3242468 RepID=UPI003557BA04
MMDEFLKNIRKISDTAFPNKNQIIEGEKFRFTVISEHILRMEYSESRNFIDKKTQIITNRDFGKIDFKIRESNEYLICETKYYKFKYKMNKKFDSKTLIIYSKILNDELSWNFGDELKNNEFGTARTLDTAEGEIKLEDGLFSKDGYTILNDSESVTFKDGWFTERKEKYQDYYLLVFGHDYKIGLKEFYQLTDHSNLIPRYAYGNWWSRYWAYNEKEINDVLDDFDKRNIPLSVCIVDMDWHLTNIPKEFGYGWTGYSWNKDLFSNPTKFIKSIKKRGMHVSLNLHPADGFRPYEDCYVSICQNMGINPKNKIAVKFNPTNLSFLKAYFEEFHHKEEERGIDFWWIDWQQGTKTEISDLDPLWILNHYHYNDINRSNKRSMIFSRYSGLGSHRYPIGFSGDAVVSWKSLEFQPYFTANAAKVGYSHWSHDIGGHIMGIEEPELYTRWVQFGVFSPIMRLHSSNGYYNKREPWRYPLLYETVVTKYMRLRHRLIPYIYTMMYKNSMGGYPLVYPMEFEDYNLIGLKNQYYFGDSLIVTPVTEKTNPFTFHSQSKVFLPKGKWYDFFTGELYDGNKEYRIYSQIEDIPVFAKEGAIIPLSLDDLSNNPTNPEHLELRIFPGNNSFDLYEDDGITFDYQKNNFVITKIETKYNNNHLSVMIHKPIGNTNLISESRSYTIKIMGLDYSKEYYFEGLERHKISIEIKNVNKVDFISKIMKILENSIIDTEMKEKVGFIDNRYAPRRGGILNEDISIKEKIKKIESLKFDEVVKRTIINLLNNII